MVNGTLVERYAPLRIPESSGKSVAQVGIRGRPRKAEHAKVQGKFKKSGAGAGGKGVTGKK